MTWAILSGIEGNLAAYEAVLADLQQRPETIETLFILGDVIGPTADNLKLVERIQQPRPGEPRPAVCLGWWEEQALTLYALGRSGEPTELIERYGMAMVKQLWDSVPRELTGWLSQLEFGFMELDCLLIHGSPAGVSEALTPETSPLRLMDRLQRLQANRLFCGRSGQSFVYEIAAAQSTSQVTTLAGSSQSTWERPGVQKVIGVGNVGREPGRASYVLYEPGSDQLRQQVIAYGAGRGFGRGASLGR